MYVIKKEATIMANLTYKDLSNRSTLTFQRFTEIFQKEQEAYVRYKRAQEFYRSLVVKLQAEEEFKEEQLDMAISWFNNSNVPIKDIMRIVFKE
jgi:hypothetical protein